MSAYMVSKIDIDLLIAVAVYGPTDVAPEHGRWRLENDAPRCLSDKNNDLDAVGDMLVKENLSSIHYRYPDTFTNPEDTPGPEEQYWLQPYKFQKPKRMPTLVEALVAITHYEYQSCEHNEWSKSQAFKFCDELRHRLIRCLPGYEKAPWGWDSVTA